MRLQQAPYAPPNLTTCLQPALPRPVQPHPTAHVPMCLQAQVPGGQFWLAGHHNHNHHHFHHWHDGIRDLRPLPLNAPGAAGAEAGPGEAVVRHCPAVSRSTSAQLAAWRNQQAPPL